MASLPVTSDDFTNGRLRPNVRRLQSMIRNGPVELLAYSTRNLTRDRRYFNNANQTAGRIILLVQRNGLAYDWETVDDLIRNHQEPETTEMLPLRGLTGHWNVSMHIFTLHNCLLTLLQSLDVVGEGGNGRAVLYFKVDATGNIVQVSDV
jgi:hypothetical protein